MSGAGMRLVWEIRERKEAQMQKHDAVSEYVRTWDDRHASDEWKCAEEER